MLRLDERSSWMAKAAFGTRTAANICAPQDDRRQGAGAGAVPGGAEVQLTRQCCCLHNPSQLPPQPVELVSAGVEKIRGEQGNAEKPDKLEQYLERRWARCR